MRQHLITMICDRCDAKAMFGNSNDPDIKRWGNIVLRVENISVGRWGTSGGRISHICPNCCTDFKKWWGKE